MLRIKNIKRISIGFVSFFITADVIASNTEGDLKREITLLREALATLTQKVDSLEKSQKDKVTSKSSKASKIDKAVTHSKTVQKAVESSQVSFNDDVSSTRFDADEVKLLKDKSGVDALKIVHVAAAKQDVQKSPENANAKVDALSQKSLPALSWKGYDITALIAGGASTGYSKLDGTNGSFNVLDFNPLFLFTYKDLLLLRASVNFELDDQGSTQTSLDFVSMNLLMHDYASLGIGKFDSGLGQFVQNLSPSWINALPDSPVGFDGDQAAPQSEIGLQLRGGFPLPLDTNANYTLFVANGPRAMVDQPNMVIDHISTDGFPKNFENYIYGGRIGFLPISNMEVGFSAAAGKLALLDLADGSTLLQESRNYNVLGADASYKWDSLSLRAEIIQQKVTKEKSSNVVPRGGTWRAWYLQAAYLIPTTAWEPVVRYGQYKADSAINNQKQWAFGINYWFSSCLAAKAAYEINDGQEGTDADKNNFIIKLVYGF
jgi:hypothetical protein